MDIVEDLENGSERAREEPRGSNIILIGGMGSGKSTVGWVFAKLIGYGYIDTDQVLEIQEKKPINQIFDEKGEAYFRGIEKELIFSLRNIRSHVISPGGGAVMDDDSWRTFNQMGTTVWLNPPNEEIARRLISDEVELKKRPLLAELAENKDREHRHKLLSERLSALIGNRSERYRKARYTVSDSFSTPDSTSRLLRDVLTKEGVLSNSKENRPYDRWRIL